MPWWARAKSDTQLGLHGSDSVRDVSRTLDQVGIWGGWRPGRRLKLFVVFTYWHILLHACIFSCAKTHSSLTYLYFEIHTHVTYDLTWSTLTEAWSQETLSDTCGCILSRIFHHFLPSWCQGFIERNYLPHSHRSIYIEKLRNEWKNAHLTASQAFSKCIPISITSS